MYNDRLTRRETEHGFNTDRLAHRETEHRSNTAYRVFYTNFYYFADREFATIEAAADFARAKGFDAAIYRGETVIAGWSYFGGLRHF